MEGTPRMTSFSIFRVRKCCASCTSFSRRTRRGGWRFEAMMRHRVALFFTLGFACMLAAGWVGFPHTLYSSARQPLEFNHRVHKDKASEKCADCHGVTADGVFMGTPALSNCAGCHAEPMGTTANEKVLVAAWVKPGREIPWRSYARQPMNVHFSHAVHVNLGKLSCERCHGERGNSTHVSL